MRPACGGSGACLLSVQCSKMCRDGLDLGELVLPRSHRSGDEFGESVVGARGAHGGTTPRSRMCVCPSCAYLSLLRSPSSPRACPRTIALEVSSEVQTDRVSVEPATRRQDSIGSLGLEEDTVMRILGTAFMCFERMDDHGRC